MLAEALRDWLPGVLQLVQPWMSTVDMQKGARWTIDLATELQQSKVGIICVTADNQAAPWMLFEAGALSKIVDTQYVIPYLLNLTPTEIQGPLVQFQAAVANRDDTFKLVSTINRLLDGAALSDDALLRSFGKWWPDLERCIGEIPPTVAQRHSPRQDRELLEELLDLTRQNTREQIERAGIAEYTAILRQRDMMTMTHQLLGPLIAISNALTVASDATDTQSTSLIEYAQALVEDAIAMSHGIATAFAAEEGRYPTLARDVIDVPGEVRRLASRIKQTNARDDLRFSFRQSELFPKLTLDLETFKSVLYSLVHNIVKYADTDSEVAFDFAVSHSRRDPSLRIMSVGAPIAASERELIFDKFVRGAQVEHGRLYRGVGLGLWIARQLMRQLGGDVALELIDGQPRVAIFVLYFGPEPTL